MDAADLQDGFHVGDWLVEPRASRATTSGRSVDLAPAQLQLLVALALKHGEAVDRRELRNVLGPGPPGPDERLRETIASLRVLFDESPRHPRYIASVGHDGYALVAHFRLAAKPVPAPDVIPPPGASSARLHWLLGELRRRSVIKVAASYLVAMWIVLQVAEVTFAPLRFPSWWMTALTILAILGLPIVIVLAWTYEITPQGVVLDPGSGGAGTVKLPRARQSLAPAIVTGVVAMAVVTGFAWWKSIDTSGTATGSSLPPAEPGARSIAVLPFVDMSPTGGNAWLGDGLSEELSTRLAQVPELRVAARTSAFEFRGKSVDVRRIGQSLGVRHVVEGSVRRDADDVRVTVQLIDTTTGYHVWAGNFDRAWRDVLVMQDDIARSVIDALQVVLEEPAATGSATSKSVDSRALEPYLAGLALLRQPGDPSILQRGENAFRAAIAIAPQFAAAHAGLCRALSRRFKASRDPAMLNEAEKSCRQALALDASLVDTEKALAALYASDDRFREAADIYRTLLERNPADAGAQLGLGEALEGLGLEPEAERGLVRAVSLDPSDWAAQTSLGRFYFHRGRLDEAIASFRRAAELAPSSASAWSNVGGAAQMKGDMETAMRAYEKSLQLEQSATGYSNLATAQYYTGRFGEAVRNFERALTLNPHDQILRGNLADALWAIDSRRQEAVALYRDAIAIGEAELAKNTGDPTLRAQLGFYYGRTGDRSRSEDYIRQAVAAGPDMLYVQYYRAVAAADRGDRNAALAGVAELIRVGYPRAMLRVAPEFRTLLHDPEYVRLMQEG